jgi:hypothetical protein
MNVSIVTTAKYPSRHVLEPILHIELQHMISGSFLTHSNPIFLPPAYTPALIYFGRERGWWVTCNYPTVFKTET